MIFPYLESQFFSTESRCGTLVPHLAHSSGVATTNIPKAFCFPLE